MLVLQVHTVVVSPAGRPLTFPIGVPDADLEAFGERMAREGGLMVVQLRLDRRPDGYAYIVEETPIFLGLAGIATVRNHHVPVRREVDEGAA